MTRIAQLRAIDGLWGHSTTTAADHLRDLIVLGELPPGARIPERELSERYGLSRTPLREALKVLAAEGLVTVVPNRGAVVSAMSVADIDAVIELLTDLETAAAEPACRLARDDEVAAIAATHAAMVSHRAAGRLLDYFRLNQTIHQAIVDAARNPVRSRVYRAESLRIHRYRFAGNLDNPRWDQAIREHELILDALQVRNGPLLRELLRMHMAGGWLVVKAALQRAEAARSAP